MEAALIGAGAVIVVALITVGAAALANRSKARQARDAEERERQHAREAEERERQHARDTETRARRALEYPPLQVAADRLLAWARIQIGPLTHTAPGQPDAFDNIPALPAPSPFWSDDVKREAEAMSAAAESLGVDSRAYFRTGGMGGSDPNSTAGRIGYRLQVYFDQVEGDHAKLIEYIRRELNP